MKQARIKSFVGFAVLSLCAFSAQAQLVQCAKANLKGNWGFSEQGTQVQGVPFPGVAFSEVGQFRVKSDGTGTGVAFLSVNGTPFPGPGSAGIPLVITDVTLDPSTCTGTATFTAGVQTRFITFVVTGGFTEFSYISTTGDITTVGTAKRQFISY